MNLRTSVVSTILRFARHTPSFRGKYRLFYSMYRMWGVSDDEIFNVRMRGTATPISVRLGSLLESKVMCLGDYEPRLSHAISLLVQKGWNCIDVGANVGLITVRLAERVGIAGRVLAIEANPALIPQLTANTHGLSNILRYAMAVAAASGEGLLAVNDPAVCSNRNATMVGARLESGALRVPVTTLDRLWSGAFDSAPVQLLKMDIEGYEFEALRGASRLLAACRPTILMEFNEPYATAMGYTLADILNYLREFGPYRAYETEGSPLRPLARIRSKLFDVVIQVDVPREGGRPSVDMSEARR